MSLVFHLFRSTGDKARLDPPIRLDLQFKYNSFAPLVIPRSTPVFKRSKRVLYQDMSVRCNSPFPPWRPVWSPEQSLGALRTFPRVPSCRMTLLFRQFPPHQVRVQTEDLYLQASPPLLLYARDGALPPFPRAGADVRSPQGDGALRPFLLLLH